MLEPVTPQEIETIKKRLKNNVSVGSDNIKTLYLKYVFPIISHMLSRVINEIFLTEKFPDNLKKAKASPIYKGGDWNDLQNSRTISVLSVASKIFEGVISNKLPLLFK